MTSDARLQLIHLGLAVCNLSELDSMLPDWIFKFSEPKLHLQDFRREGFAETIRLFGGPPVGEIRQGAGCVLDDDIFHPILKAACPGKDAFDAGRVRRDHADRRKADAGRGDILVHRLEPIGGNLPGTSSHVGKDDRCTAVEMIDKGIETRRSVNVDLGHGAVEKVLQRTTRLVLRIEIEQSDRNLIGGKPLGQGRP